MQLNKLIEIVKRLHTAFFLFFFNVVLSAQTEPALSMLSVNEGLSQGMIFDIIQSREGYIWFATKDGLNRYDGSRFKVFTPDPFNPFALGGSEVLSIFEDSRAWIWLVTQNSLDVLDPASGLFFHVYHKGKPLFNPAGKLAETPDGSIWFSDNDKIWKIKFQNNLLIKASKGKTANIEPICKPIFMNLRATGRSKKLNAGDLLFCQNNKLLVGTNHGLFRVDFIRDEIVPELTIDDWSVRIIVENEKGEVLGKAITPDNSRHWFWIKEDKPYFYKDPSPLIYSASSFSFDAGGNLWTFRDRTIQKWKLPVFFNNGKPELEIRSDSIFSNQRAYCTKFIFDKSGVGWVGLNGYGIFKINQKAGKFKNYLVNASHHHILETPDAGMISVEKPRIKYPGKNFIKGYPHSDYFSNLELEKIALGRLAVCFDDAGNGWSSFREDSLLYRMDAVTKSIKSYRWRGDGLLYDRSGMIVSVSEVGLHKLDPQKETIVTHPFPRPQKRVSESSHFLFEDVSGHIWIFGFEGLTKATLQGQRYLFTQFVNNPKDRSSLSSNIVMSVADDPVEPTRYLWVGTKGGGLNRLDKATNKFKLYKTEQGLPDNVIYGILAENTPNKSNLNKKNSSHIWMSTNKGLCRFDVRSERTKNFKASDGIQDNEFNSASYLKTRDGTMIFGGVKGLTLFHPDSLKFNENIPPVQIVDLYVNNVPLPESFKSSRLTLAHDQNLLTFDFAALEFTNSAQNQYRYQLVGVDKDWVSLGNKNSIQFANLAPGNYTFKVEGSNNDGTWSKEAASLEFTIRPPWWSSWWAIVCYILICVLGAHQFYRYRLQQKLEHQETIRLREIDEFKSKFFTNITHEFRTPLTVMLGMSNHLENREDNLEKRNYIHLIKRNGESLLRLINQILDLSKIESQVLTINYIQGDVLAFIKYLSESMHSLANAQNLILRVESDQTKIVMDYDPERLLQIAHNLISNAIKFTPSGGMVVIKVSQSDNWFYLSVADTGPGIAKEEISNIFDRYFQANNQQHAKAGGTGIGLSFTKELVKAMKGEINVESEEGMGAIFKVKLPVTHHAVYEEFRPDPIYAQINKTTNLVAYQHMPEKGLTSELLDGHPAQVLVIEDNADVMDYIHTCLRENFELIYAYNGHAGIEIALERLPDIIISDVMMPNKDGFDVLDMLKNDERTSHIPIVLLTAKSDVQSRLKGLRKGADYYLSKPFHREELLVTIHNLLETRKKLQVKYGQMVLFPSVQASIVPDLDDGFLQKIYSIVDAHYQDDAFGLMQLCQKIGMSRSQLFRKMKALTDIAPSDLIRKHRLNKSKILLQSGGVNVSEAAWQVGFKDPSYFSKLFQDEFGVAPSATRKQQ